MRAREEIYEGARMDETARVGYGDRPAIVVVDLQYGETDTNSPMGSDLSILIDRVNELVDVAHEENVPVVWTRVVYTHANAADAGLWTRKVPAIAEWTEGSRWVEIDDRCYAGADDHVLDKRHASAFHGTELGSMLTAWGCDTVVVAGCSTSACIRSTVDAASAHGYHTIVPENCVDDRSADQHKAHLWDIDRKFADVEPLPKVLDYLRER